jgi:hypothetical protein
MIAFAAGLLGAFIGCKSYSGPLFHWNDYNDLPWRHEVEIGRRLEAFALLVSCTCGGIAIQLTGVWWISVVAALLAWFAAAFGLRASFRPPRARA